MSATVIILADRRTAVHVARVCADQTVRDLHGNVVPCDICSDAVELGEMVEIIAADGGVSIAHADCLDD